MKLNFINSANDYFEFHESRDSFNDALYEQEHDDEDPNDEFIKKIDFELQKEFDKK